MVGVDAADDRGHLLPGVAVGVHRVVHEPGPDGAVGRATRAHPLVGAPLGSREDPRLRRHPGARRGEARRALDGGGAAVRRGGGPSRGEGGSRVDHGEPEVARQGGPGAADPDLHRVDVADDQRVGAGTGAGSLIGGGVGSVPLVEQPPGRPDALGACAHADAEPVVAVLVARVRERVVGRGRPGGADHGVPGHRSRTGGDDRVARGCRRLPAARPGGASRPGHGDRELAHLGRAGCDGEAPCPRRGCRGGGDRGRGGPGGGTAADGSGDRQPDECQWGHQAACGEHAEPGRASPDRTSRPLSPPAHAGLPRCRRWLRP